MHIRKTMSSIVPRGTIGVKTGVPPCYGGLTLSGGMLLSHIILEHNPIEKLMIGLVNM
jgi:hypothetical protein